MMSHRATEVTFRMKQHARLDEFQRSDNTHQASRTRCWLYSRMVALNLCRCGADADVSEAGEGWSDSRIIEALDASSSMVYRVRKQLVEEGLAAVLSRKQRATPAVAPIFD